MSAAADRPPGPQPERRLSLLAIGGLLSSLACLPPLGLLGAILGGLGLWKITTARGRLGGRTPALAAVVLGLVSSLLWTAFAVGTASALSRLEAAYAPAVAAAFSRDHAALADSLTASAHERLTPDALARFADRVERDIGPYDRFPRGLAESFVALADTDRGFPAFHAAEAQYPRVQLGVITARLGSSWTSLILVSSSDLSDRMPTGATRLEDLGVLLPDARILWLSGGDDPAPLP